jgi:hypothetical protein
MKKARRVSPPQVRRITGIPCAMVLTAYSTLSPAIGLVVTVTPEKRQLPKDVMPASRHQDHMAWPSAPTSFVA